MKLGKTTPILRIFDEAKAKEFYVDFLGFKVDWEHRFEPGLPLYLQVSRGDCVLHLSEHSGGIGAEIAVGGSRHARVRCDPFGNRLTFTMPA